MLTPIRVLLVDDSGLMRLLIADILKDNNQILVVGTACNGSEAVDKCKELRPDVVLLDLVMEEYDGLYALKRIMAEIPTRVLILSSLGRVNPDSVIDALNLGAFDFLNKPEGAVGAKIRSIASEISSKILEASKSDLKKLINRSNQQFRQSHTFESNLRYKILVIGASTGGTSAIEEVLSKLPHNFSLPIVIAQHIPHEFAHSFARRLSAQLNIDVSVANDGDLVSPSRILLAPGNTNLYLKNSEFNNGVVCAFTNKLYREFNYPSVDCLFDSAANLFGNETIAVLLTGMGRDGASGMKNIFDNGGLTIAQSELSSVVFGMPKAAIDLNAVTAVVPLNEIGLFVTSSL